MYVSMTRVWIDYDLFMVALEKFLGWVERALDGVRGG
jgi:hypothetical protein